eukprot:gene6904-9456_t
MMFIGFFGSVFFINISSFYDSKQISTDQIQVNRNLVVNKSPKLLPDQTAVFIQPKILPIPQSQQNFETTLKSCLGKSCFDDSVNGIQRIGLLSPDKKSMEIILKMIKSTNFQSTNKITVELVVDSHVPAYGYGKNHGWSRIIRLVTGIVPHAYSILKSTTDNQVKPELFALQIRQLMRWHCRLSHVAAHTAMLTIFADDLINRPVFELERILTFLNYKASREELLQATQPSNSDKNILNELISSFRIDSNSNSNIPENLLLIAENTINDEMKISKDLTKWPCKSFRELDKTVTSLGGELPLKSYELAANCSNSFVTCSVPYDMRGG